MKRTLPRCPRGAGQRPDAGDRPHTGLLPTLLGLCLALLGLTAPADAAELPAATAVAATHPTDGPDVDVRIYLDDRSVRFRVDANLAFLDEVVEVPRELDDQLAPVEERGAALALFDRLTEANRVAVDGVEIDAELTSWKILPADPDLIPLFPISGAKALIRVRLDYSYPLLGGPRRAAMRWGLFPIDPVVRVLPGEDPVPIQVGAQLNAGGYDYPLLFTVDEPEFIWHGELPDEDELFLPVPEPVEQSADTGWPAAPLLLWPLGILGFAFSLRSGHGRAGLLALLVMLGAGFFGRDLVRIGAGDPSGGLPDDAEALAIFEPLHQNIYRAFGFDDEERIYDALARSVDGELLEALYLQVYRGLILEEHGGAVSRVQAVRPVETEVEEIGLLEGGRPGFTLRTRWQVDGAVFHFAHAHRRTQEYEARYTVAEVPLAQDAAESGWRIVGNQVLEQTVLATADGLGESEPDENAVGAPGVLFPADREL